MTKKEIGEHRAQKLKALPHFVGFTENVVGMIKNIFAFDTNKIM